MICDAPAPGRRSPPPSTHRSSRTPFFHSDTVRTCLGTGLVVLDAVYSSHVTGPRCCAGGSCCNVLTILSWLGWQSCPIARLGDDHYAEHILQDMSRFGVDLSFVEKDPRITTPRIIQRTLDGPTSPRHKFFFRCEHGKRLPRWRVPSSACRDVAMNNLFAPDIFYFDRATRGALDMAKRCRAFGSLVVFEPPGPPKNTIGIQCASISDVVKTCRRGDGSLADSLMLNGQLQISTMSEAGLEYEVRLNKRAVSGKMIAINTDSIADTSGAGDWLTAGFLYTLPKNTHPTRVSRRILEHALRFGQSLAAINCRYAGARGAMYSNTAQAVLSAARAAASAGIVDPKMLGGGRGAAASPVPPGGRCAPCTCDTEQ